MTEKPPTRLDDARALKRMNIPLNTPVEPSDLQQGIQQALVCADECAHRVHAGHARILMMPILAPANGSWFGAGLLRSDKAAVRCFDFVAELGGNVPVGAEPVFKSEQDAHEYVRLGAFIAERALPFIEFWADAVDVVEASGTLTITASDIPRWVDEDTA